MQTTLSPPDAEHTFPPKGEKPKMDEVDGRSASEFVAPIAGDDDAPPRRTTSRGSDTGDRRRCKHFGASCSTSGASFLVGGEDVL